MKRALSILIDAGLFLAMLLAWGIIAILTGGFLEIAFAMKVFSSTLGLIVLAVVILAGACWLAFLGPKAAFNQTAGQSLVFRSQVNGLKPFKYYMAWLGILLGIYAAMWLASAVIFGSMARNQEKVVQALGVPDDWRQAFPEYSADGNAAPLLRLACDSLKKNDPLFTEASIDWAFRTVTEKPDSITAAWPVVDQLVALNKKSLDWFDQASRCQNLFWQDYRSIPIDSMMQMPLPNYMALQNLCKLSMLQATRAIQRGQAPSAATDIDRAVRVLKLQLGDPTMIGKMIGIAQVGIISNGLAALARTDPKSYALIKVARDSLPDVAGQVRQGMIAEITLIGNLIWRGKNINALFLLSSYPRGQSPKNDGVQIIASIFNFVFYRIWSPWDKYCYLKASEISLRAADPKNDTAAVAGFETQSEKFNNERQRLPALFSSIAMPNFVSMYKRELEARARPANALLFAAVLDYHQKRGKWPEYFQELPKNPVDGEYYTYILSKDRMEVRGNDSKGESLLKSAWVKY